METEIKYRHMIHPDKGNPFTLAYYKQENTYILGVSICSKKDDFNRVMGRRVSKSRLLSIPKADDKIHILLIPHYDVNVQVKFPKLLPTPKNNFWRNTIENIFSTVPIIIEKEEEELIYKANKEKKNVT